MLTEAGLDRRPVTSGEITAIEPALHGNYYGGFFTPSDSTGDIHKFTRGLAEACMRRGVDFDFDTVMLDVAAENGGIDIQWRRMDAESKSRGRYDAIVVCAGVESRKIAAELGDRVNIYPVKGYSITVHLDSEVSRAAAPWVSLLDDEAKIVTSRLGHARFRVAGTAEFNGMNRDIRHDRIHPLVRWTRQLFPGVDTDRVVPWTGLRPMLPNMMPRVGRGNRPGVFYNTAHGHLGWTLSAATAEILAMTVAWEMPL